jgi:hypothetical protein
MATLDQYQWKKMAILFMINYSHHFVEGFSCHQRSTRVQVDGVRLSLAKQKIETIIDILVNFPERDS